MSADNYAPVTKSHAKSMLYRRENPHGDTAALSDGEIDMALAMLVSVMEANEKAWAREREAELLLQRFQHGVSESIAKGRIVDQAGLEKLMGEANRFIRPAEPSQCRCIDIMAADRTRHFRGCPQREKYPTHEAEEKSEAAYAKTLVSKFEKDLQAQRKHMESDAAGYAGQHANIEVARVRDAVRFLLANVSWHGDMPLDVLKRIESLEERTKVIEYPRQQIQERIKQLEGKMGLIASASFFDRIKALEEIPHKVMREEHEVLVTRIESLEAHATSQHASPQDVQGRLADLENVSARQSEWHNENFNNRLLWLEEKIQELCAEHFIRRDEPQRCGVRYGLPPERAQAHRLRKGHVVYAICSKDIGHSGPHGAFSQADIDAREQLDDRLDFASVPRAEASVLLPFGCACSADEGRDDAHTLKPCVFHQKWRDLEVAKAAEKFVREKELLSLAWGVIANAYNGDWDAAPQEWHMAAIMWRERYMKDDLAAGRTPAFMPLPKSPKIVVLCGSTRFSKAFADANLAETLAGNIVLTVGSMMHSDAHIRACIKCKTVEGNERVTPEANACERHIWDSLESPNHADTKKALDELHKRKIEIADEVFVLNVKMCRHCNDIPQSEKWERKVCKDSQLMALGSPCDYQPYIGASTRSEIRHAVSLGKKIRFLNPQGPQGCVQLDANDTSGNTVEQTMHTLGLVP